MRVTSIFRDLIRCHAIPLAAVLLSVVLAGLKIQGVLDWRWRRVLLPLWGPPAIVVVGWLTLVIAARLFCVFQDRFLTPPPRTGPTSTSLE